MFSPNIDILDLNSDLEALTINPPPEICALVQKIMYLKKMDISASDVIRSKVLKETDQIVKLFKLCELLRFAELETTVSSSNRNYGNEIYILKKKSSQEICQTAQGRARLNLFRINKDLI